MDVHSPCARYSVLLKYTLSLPQHFHINSPSKQRKHCSHVTPHPLTHYTHTHSHTLWAYEALFAVFLSRFPSLSTRKAWERRKEEADAETRDSLELFWPVKVTEAWHATWAKISCRSFLKLIWVLSKFMDKTMAKAVRQLDIVFYRAAKAIRFLRSLTCFLKRQKTCKYNFWNN